MTPDERLAALNQTLQRSRHAPLYRERVPAQPLNSLAELKTIPLTTKQDLRDNYPFGLICVPRTELYQYHETFGTTGTPASTWLTREDLQDNAWEVNMSGINFTENDTVLVRFPYAISAIAHMVHIAAQQKNACVIPAGARSPVSPFPRIISLLQMLEVTVLACLPLQAVLLAETAELLGYRPDRDFPHLRAVLTAGEPLTDGRRRLIESLWGVPVIDIYGMAEIGTAIVNCQYGRPHPLEDYFIFEVLAEDLKTDAKPGELGYLVVTTLRKKATPVIRYLTEDRARIMPEQCHCGREFALEVHGRKQDTLKIGRKHLDLWDLEEIVFNLPGRRFWVVGPNGEGLKFIVEEEAGGQMDPAVKRYLEEKFELTLTVEVVPKGTLYDRSELLAVGEVGKPRYIYTAEELTQKVYLKSVRV